MSQTGPSATPRMSPISHFGALKRNVYFGAGAPADQRLCPPLHLLLSSFLLIEFLSYYFMLTLNITSVSFRFICFFNDTNGYVRACFKYFNEFTKRPSYGITNGKCCYMVTRMVGFLVCFCVYFANE